jgi:hypothetical protein
MPREIRVVRGEFAHQDSAEERAEKSEKHIAELFKELTTRPVDMDTKTDDRDIKVQEVAYEKAQHADLRKVIAEACAANPDPDAPR